jgi:hypothetical protein
MLQSNEVRVLGATIHGFAQACLDLNIVAGLKGKPLAESGAHLRIGDIAVNEWYPFERLREIEKLVLRSYENVGPILERVGIEMMTSWYRLGPGRQLISGGVDFLRFQSGSQGYASVIQGPEEMVGSFKLSMLDEASRVALIHSTTPFNKHLERGVIIGGMSAPGDLDYIDVKNHPDEHFFRIEF